MDRKLGGLIFCAFLAASAPAAAEELQDRNNSELCVDREAFTILGGAFDGYSQEAYEAELARRGETCEPRSFYADVARNSIRNIVQSVMLGAPSQPTAQQPPQRTWSQRMGDAGRAYLQMQQEQQARQRANAPRTTNCYNTAVGVTCTTN